MGHLSTLELYTDAVASKGYERHLESTGFYGPFPIAYGTAFENKHFLLLSRYIFGGPPWQVVVSCFSLTMRPL